jgi:hypothetical protein
VTAGLRGVAKTTPQADRWCDGLPDVTAEFHCGGQRHRIVWRRGKLVLADHDLLAERTLTVLGCEAPLCVEVLDAWLLLRSPELLHAFLDRAGDTVSPEELAARKAEHEDVIQRARSLSAGAAQVLRGLLPSGPKLIERERRAWAMTLLEALPPDFRRMLVLAMIVAIDRRWRDESFRDAHREHVEPVLKATAARLIERSARHGRDSLKRYTPFDIESRVLARDEPPQCSVRFDDDGGVGSVALPLAWFTDVWSRGLALVEGSFVTRCVGPATADPAARHVLAVRWERDGGDAFKAVQAPALATRDDDGAWSLRWP